MLLRRHFMVWVWYEPRPENHCQICRPHLNTRFVGGHEHVLVAFIKFLSALRAKTDNRSRTYKRRYWLGRGIDWTSFLYVAMTSSWLEGFFAVQRWDEDIRCINESLPNASRNYPRKVSRIENGQTSILTWWYKS